MPTPFAQTITTSAAWWCSRARAIDVGRAARPAARVRRDGVDARAGDESHATLERLRPVREIGGGLRAIRTAREARAAQAARAQVAVRARGDRLRPGPPVPAEAVHARGRSPADLADRQRRKRRARARGIGRIAGHAGDREVLLHSLVVRHEVVVGEGPVVGDPVERPDAEVGRQEPHPVRRVEDRAAADARPHQRIHVGVGRLAGIVRGQTAHVRVRVPLPGREQLPLRLRAGELGGVGPAALLEADDAEARTREPQRRNRAGHARPDDEHICTLRPRRLHAASLGNRAWAASGEAAHASAVSGCQLRMSLLTPAR